MTDTVLLYSPAKINLFLNVTGQRPDGFHNLVSVFLRLDSLADTLTINPGAPNTGLTLACNMPELTSPANLLHAVYQAFYQALPQLIPLDRHIYLNKRIPLQAGLGGGSSNAATLLQYLYHQHQQPCDDATLQAIGASVGSDVSFFLRAHFNRTVAKVPVSPQAWAALVTGRGETLTPIIMHRENPVLVRRWLVVKPPAGMSTPAAYQALRSQNRYISHSVNPLLSCLATVENPEMLFLNDFEPVVESAMPEMAWLWKHLQILGVKRPLLCGSGAAVAGLLPDKFDENQLKGLKDKNYFVTICQAVGAG